MARNMAVKISLTAIDRVSGPVRGVRSQIAKMQRENLRANYAINHGVRVGRRAPGPAPKDYAQTAAALNQAAEATDRFATRARSLAGAPVAAAMEFEDRMQGVKAFVSGADNAATFDRLTAKALELGTTTRFSASEAADGLRMLGQAGFSAERAMSELPAVLDLASAGQLELGRAAEIGSDIMGAFGLKAPGQFKRVADVLAQTANSSTTDVAQLAEGMKYAAPIAHAAGYELEELATMMGLVADAGIKASQSGTAINAMLTRLAAPPKQARKELRRLGVSTKDAFGNLKRPVELLAEIDDKISGIKGNARQLEAIKKIFGQWAMPAAAKLLQDASGDEIRKRLVDTQAASTGEGAAKTMAKTREDSIAGDVRRLGNVAEATATRIGKKLTPALRNFTNTLIPAVRWVGDFSDRHPILTKVVGLGAIGIAGLASALVPLILTLAAASGAMHVLTSELSKKLFGGLARASVGIASFIARLVVLSVTMTTRAVVASGAFIASMVRLAATALVTAVPSLGTLATAVWGVSAAFLASPLGWFTLAVVGIAAAAYLVYDNWERLGPFFKGLWADIKAQTQAAVTWITAKLQPLIDVVHNGLETLGLASDRGPVVRAVASDEESAVVSAEPMTDEEVAAGEQRTESAIDRAVGVAGDAMGGFASGGRIEGVIRVALELPQGVTARVKELRSRGVELDVDTGLTMVTG